MNTATMERPATKEHAVVTIQYVNEPKGAAVSGSIKDTNGDYWGIHKSGLSQVRGQEGQRVEFDFVATANGFRNVDVKTIQIVANGHRVENYPSRNAPPRAQAHDARQDVQRSAPGEHQPQNGNGCRYRQPAHPYDAEQMWVCKMLGDLIAAHIIKDDVNDMDVAITNLRQLWRKHFGQEDAAG